MICEAYQVILFSGSKFRGGCDSLPVNFFFGLTAGSLDLVADQAARQL